MAKNNDVPKTKNGNVQKQQQAGNEAAAIPGPASFSPISGAANPWLGRQAAEGFSSMLPGMAGGPGQAFSPDQLSNMHAMGREQLEASKNQAMAGAQMAQGARGASGPDLSSIMGSQMDAAHTGALASADLQSQLQGLNLGLDQYAAQGQVGGMMGQLAQGYGQMEEEQRQFDFELGEAQRQFDAAQGQEEKMSFVADAKSRSESARAAADEYLSTFSDDLMKIENNKEYDIWKRKMTQMETRARMAENQYYSFMDPSMRGQQMQAIGQTMAEHFQMNPWDLPGIFQPGLESEKKEMEGFWDFYAPGGMQDLAGKRDWWTGDTASRQYDIPQGFYGHDRSGEGFVDPALWPFLGLNQVRHGDGEYGFDPAGGFGNTGKVPYIDYGNLLGDDQNLWGLTGFNPYGGYGGGMFGQPQQGPPPGPPTYNF